jgi:hypothetical protein
LVALWVTKDNGFRMREDCGVNIVFTCLAALVTVLVAVGAFRRGPDGPNWELRWRGLNPDDRSRIVAAAREDRDTPSDPEDLELVSGYRRRRRRWRGYIELPVFSLLLVLAVFMLNGAMRPGLFGIVFAVTAILSDRGLDWWERRMYGTRPVPADPDAAL